MTDKKSKTRFRKVDFARIEKLVLAGVPDDKVVRDMKCEGREVGKGMHALPDELRTKFSGRRKMGGV